MPWRASRKGASKRTRERLEAGITATVLAVFQANESLAKRLFNNLEETSDKIAYTRNHYTHYTSGTGHEKFIDQDGMAQLNFSLEHFLWALLLKEIGAPESAGHKIIRTAEGAKFTTLAGPKPPEQALAIQLEPPASPGAATPS